MKKLILLSIFFCHACSDSIEIKNSSFLAEIAGVWSIKHPKIETCVDKKYMHTIEVNSKKDRLTFTNHEPIEMDIHGGQETKEYSYKVLYTNNDSATLFLNGETRKLGSGDLLIWQLILKNNDYMWRVYGTPTDIQFKTFAVRCN